MSGGISRKARQEAGRPCLSSIGRPVVAMPAMLPLRFQSKILGPGNDDAAVSRVYRDRGLDLLTIRRSLAYNGNIGNMVRGGSGKMRRGSSTNDSKNGRQEYYEKDNGQEPIACGSSAQRRVCIAPIALLDFAKWPFQIPIWSHRDKTNWNARPPEKRRGRCLGTVVEF